MPITGNVLVLESEDEAWKLLAALVGSKPDSVPQIRTVTVPGWPEPLLHLTNLPINGALTLPIMESLGEYQRAVWRGYSQSLFGVKDIRRVPIEKRKKMLLHFVVKNGTTTVKVDPQELANGLISGALDKMPPEYLLLIILAFILLYFGADAFKHWVTSRDEVKRRKLESDQVQFMSSQETERAKILASAIGKAPPVALIEQNADRAMQALTRGAQVGGGADVLGRKVSTEEAERLLETDPPEGQGKRVEADFAVDAIDATVKAGHRFEFGSVDGSQTIEAEVVPVEVSAAEVDLLWEASRHKFPVHVVINAWEVGGKIERAFVMKVTRVPKK